MPRQGRISEALEALAKLQSIEYPEQKAKVLREWLPFLEDIAHKTKEEKIIATVRKLAKNEKETRNYWNIETLRTNLNGLRRGLEDESLLLPRDAVDSFFACIEQFDKRLAIIEPSYQKLVGEMFLTTKQLVHQLVGRRLEEEIAPKLLKKMGYELGPTVYSDSGVELEVDSLGEKTETSAPDGQGKIRVKRVRIIECKTTVTAADIRDFSRKVAVIKNKYERTAQIFENQLIIDAWIIACYGWTEELKKMSTEGGIKPLAGDELEDLLLQHGLHDRRFPVCPEMSDQNDDT
jgi:hypothetical protein